MSYGGRNHRVSCSIDCLRVCSIFAQQRVPVLAFCTCCTSVQCRTWHSRFPPFSNLVYLKVHFVIDTFWNFETSLKIKQHLSKVLKIVEECSMFTCCSVFQHRGRNPTCGRLEFDWGRLKCLRIEFLKLLIKYIVKTNSPVFMLALIWQLCIFKHSITKTNSRKERKNSLGSPEICYVKMGSKAKKVWEPLPNPNVHSIMQCCVIVRTGR